MSNQSEKQLLCYYADLAGKQRVQHAGRARGVERWYPVFLIGIVFLGVALVVFLAWLFR